MLAFAGSTDDLPDAFIPYCDGAIVSAHALQQKSECVHKSDGILNGLEVDEELARTDLGKTAFQTGDPLQFLNGFDGSGIDAER